MTPQMEAVVTKLRETGKPLVRWPSGWWSYQGCSPSTSDRYKPSWIVPTDVVRRMESHGLLRRLNHFPEPWRDHRELVQ